MAGDAETGVCLMWMARTMDAGDVIACAATPMTPEDTGGTLTERLSHLSADLLLAWLPALADGTAPRHPQDPAQVTFAPPIRKEEREIDWSQPGETIALLVRALAPTPAAVSTFRSEPLKILFAQPCPWTGGAPGAVVEIRENAGPVVAAGKGERVAHHRAARGANAQCPARNFSAAGAWKSVSASESNAPFPNHAKNV